MRLRTMFLLLAAVLLGGVGGAVEGHAQVQAGVVLDRDGLRHFHLVLGDHYGVPHRTVSRVHAPWLHPDEVPVVLFIAREARVSPEAVLALRELGWSWWEVSMHLGLSPAVYVRHLPSRVGPPYGRAHGYWRNRSPVGIRHLSDRQIVDFVNLGLHMERYRRPATEVIVRRDRGRDFYQIMLGYSGGSGFAAGVRGGPPGAVQGPSAGTGPPGRVGPPGRRGPPGRTGPPGRRGGGIN